MEYTFDEGIEQAKLYLEWANSAFDDAMNIWQNSTYPLWWACQYWRKAEEYRTKLWDICRGADEMLSLIELGREIDNLYHDFETASPVIPLMPSYSADNDYIGV